MVEYGDGSMATGDLYTDTVLLAGCNVRSVLVVFHFHF